MSRPPQKRKTAVRASRQIRGYDAEYERNRAIMIQHARAYDLPCVICDRPFAPDQAITAEHLTPKRRGGGNKFEDLGPAHSRCNSGWRRRRR